MGKFSNIKDTIKNTGIIQNNKKQLDNKIYFIDLDKIKPSSWNRKIGGFFSLTLDPNQ